MYLSFLLRLLRPRLRLLRLLLRPRLRHRLRLFRLLQLLRFRHPYFMAVHVRVRRITCCTRAPFHSSCSSVAQNKIGETTVSEICLPRPAWAEAAATRRACETPRTAAPASASTRRRCREGCHGCRRLLPCPRDHAPRTVGQARPGARRPPFERPPVACRTSPPTGCALIPVFHLRRRWPMSVYNKFVLHTGYS